MFVSIFAANVWKKTGANDKMNEEKRRRLYGRWLCWIFDEQQAAEWTTSVIDCAAAGHAVQSTWLTGTGGRTSVRGQQLVRLGISDSDRSLAR